MRVPASANTYSSPPRARTSCMFDLSFSSSASFGQYEREKKKSGELGRERLRRGDADLDAGVGEEGEPRRAQHRAGGDVADPERALVAEPLRVLQRRERVGGLAR